MVEFTEEQINTPLHHQEAQTLARIAAIFELVKQITSLNPQEYPINLEVELLSRIDEVDPRVTDLQKSPAASLEYTRLVNKAAPVLQNFTPQGSITPVNYRSVSCGKRITSSVGFTMKKQGSCSLPSKL